MPTRRPRGSAAQELARDRRPCPSTWSEDDPRRKVYLAESAAELVNALEASILAAHRWRIRALAKASNATPRPRRREVADLEELLEIIGPELEKARDLYALMRKARTRR